MQIRNEGVRDKLLGAITPNTQTRLRYQEGLRRAVAEMQNAYERKLIQLYRLALIANQEADRLPIGADAKGPTSRINDLLNELKSLGDYWEKYFDKFAVSISVKITNDWLNDNTRQWKVKLKRAGFTVPLEITPSQKLFLKTKITENVSLIKSIQEIYHKDVEGIVLRSFSKGRDLSKMTQDLVARGRVTQHKAAFIATDQANKATAQLNGARQRELGIEYAVWIHSAGGKEPRATHVRAGREQWIYKIGEGIDFNDQFGHVLPGEAINCRCTSRSIIPALGRGDIRSDEDLSAVSGFSGAYRAREGRNAGGKSKMDVEKTRIPKGSPVKYS